MTTVMRFYTPLTHLMTECNEQLKQLMKEEKLKKVPLLVYANKSDLPNVFEADEIVEKI